ncbi:MAG TPA: aromatic amino acid lyase, partial [Actinomycetota bacterium]
MNVRVGEPLAVDDVVAVADGAPVSFASEARARVEAGRAVIDRAIASGATIYGVTTGFGALAHTRVDPSDGSTLQHGIVRSHATAVGAALAREEARAMLL